MNIFPKTKSERIVNHYSDGIDLRYDMETILNYYGFFVLLHRNYRIHCNCFREDIYKNGEKGCSYCNGTGFVNRIEKHLTRRMVVMERTMGGSMRDAEFGRMLVDDYKFFFHHYVMPKPQDLIYMVTWDNSDMPTHLIYEYEVVNTNELRGNNGRIEYWATYCRQRPFGKKEIKNSFVRKIEESMIDKSYEDAELQYDLIW